MPELTPALLLVGAVLVSLTFYVLMGGADFGGGVWDLFARGPRRAEQRALIADAIGPIWEANHVWLILVVVILFTCFPPVFARVSVTLHIPLTLMLIGIVLRGSAFTFRTYDSQRDDVQRRWSVVFSVSSLVTPVILGMCVGAIVAGRVPEGPSGTFADAYVDPWWNPFALSVGLLTLVLFAFLAATYLTVEAAAPELKEDFRRRALASGVALFGAAALALALSRGTAPLVFHGLTTDSGALGFHVLTAASAVTALWALWTRRFKVARLAAAAQATFILWGWALSQFPHVIPPDLGYEEAAAPAVTLKLVLGALALGAVVLFPSLWYLFRIFKSRPSRSRAPLG